MRYRTSAAEVVEQAVLEGRGRVVSISDMIFAIRAAIPDCEHTSDELAQLVAAIAIRHGCNLSFGNPSPETDVVRFEPAGRNGAKLRGRFRAVSTAGGFWDSSGAPPANHNVRLRSKLDPTGTGGS